MSDKPYMKAIGLILIMFFSTISFAKHDQGFSQFNQEITDSIDLIIKDNPEVYEKEGRTPASLRTSPEKTSDKLDNFEEQVHGAQSW